MAWCVAVVRAHNASLRAVLLANVRVSLAYALMADFDAFMQSAFQRFVARQSTTEVLLAARNNFPLFVFAVTEFRGECHARRTSGR